MKKILIALIVVVLLVLVGNVGFYFYLKNTESSQSAAVVVQKTKAEKDIASLSGDVDALNDFDLSEIDSIEQSLSSTGNDLNGI